MSAKARKPTLIKPPSAPNLGPGGRKFGISVMPLHFQSPLDTGQIPPQPWRDLPPPTGQPPFRLGVESVVPADVIQRINSSGKMVFHMVGDTGGINETSDEENVASYMEQDFSSNAMESNPAFYYHLGDVVYYEGEGMNYYAQFYEPYNRYPAPILAIPGNHDGDVDPTTGETSLEAFVRNFCAQVPIHSPDAKDATRDAMTQPNVYWTLQTPLLTIIGLYSNCPEGGQLSADQMSWFASELQAAPTDKALIVAVHHPIYSAYGAHPGSQPLKDLFERTCANANRVPDAVFTGHVHNYQRFNGQLCGKPVPFFVVGAGGYNKRLHVLAQPFHDGQPPFEMPGSVGTLESFCDQSHGYMRVDVTKGKITCNYFAVPDPSVPQGKPLAPFDTLEIPFSA